MVESRVFFTFDFAYPIQCSTFVPVKCVTCGCILGKVYKTTARAFDHIRDYFTLSVEAVNRLVVLG